MILPGPNPLILEAKALPILPNPKIPTVFPDILLRLEVNDDIFFPSGGLDQ